MIPPMGIVVRFLVGAVLMTVLAGLVAAIIVGLMSVVRRPATRG